MLKNIFIFIFVCPMLINAQESFITGNDTICDNGSPANIRVDFLGSPPFTFVYSVNGVNQSSITTQNTPYLISTSIAGTYTLQNFNDAISVGTVSGSAIVTVNLAPIATIHIPTDTLTILHPTANSISQSQGNIVGWDWNFGDNTTNDATENPKHTFPLDAEGLGISSLYQIALIVSDNNGCLDTAIRQVWVNEEYWIYIPSSFTPDYDKKNDVFCIEYHAIREKTFLFKVYNAQGDLMYQSTKANELRCSVNGGWDGTHYESGIDLPPDTYVYEMYFQDFEGWKHKEYGHIILIR
jgi:gliding motility-associated-like protein